MIRRMKILLRVFMELLYRFSSRVKETETILRGLDTLGNFSPRLTREKTFVTFCLFSCTPIPRGANYFLSE